MNGNWRSFRYAVCCLSLLVYCLFLAACAGQKAANPTDKRYKTILKKWTREGKGYENFETKLIIKATFRTEEFRESYVNEYSKVYMLDGEKLKKFKEDEIMASKNYHEFLLSVHTPVREWSELERKEPTWAIFMINDSGDKVAPLELKRQKEKAAYLKRFYPFIDDWSEVYTVKFPIGLSDGRLLIANETKYVKFIMTGPYGKGDLTWELK